MLTSLNNFSIKIRLYQNIFMTKIAHTYKMWISNRNPIKIKNLSSITSRHDVVSNLPHQRKTSILSPNNHSKLIPATNSLSSESRGQVGTICPVLSWGCRTEQTQRVWARQHCLPAIPIHNCCTIHWPPFSGSNSACVLRAMACPYLLTQYTHFLSYSLRTTFSKIKRKVVWINIIIVLFILVK